MASPKVLLLIALLAGQTPQYPPPYPRPGTTQVFENDAIAVWDVAWLKQKYPLHTHRLDLIGVPYVEGDRVITQGDAPGRFTTTRSWVFQSNVAGNTHGLRQVVGAPSWENRGTFAWAIPPGATAPTHRHVRDAVELVVAGATPATTPKVGFVPAGTVHAGPAPEAGGRAFIFEIK